MLPDPCTYGDDLTAELYDGVLTSQATREDPAKAQQAIKDALNAHIANYLEGANASGDESSPYSGYSSTAISTIQTTAVYETWDESTTSLNAVGQLVVQAIVAVATAGAGNAILAGTTAAGNAIVSAAVQSVVNQLSTEILTAVITGESLNIDLGSLVTNAVKSAVFAGVTEAMDTEMFSDAVNDEGVFNPDKLNYTQKAVRNISHASVSTLVYGGDFKQNVINAVGESVAAPAFNYIGHTLTGTDGLKLDKNALSTKALITTSHALVGGAVAELTGGEFSSGAVATAVGHVVGEFIKDRALENLDIDNLPFDPNNPNSIQSYVDQLENETIAIASAVGGATVLLTQEGVTAEELDRATSLSASVVENNVLCGGLCIVGIIGGILTVYDTYTTYEEQGIAGAAQTLITDGVITAAGGGIFKVGGKAFSGIKDAYDYYKKVEPKAVAKLEKKANLRLHKKINDKDKIATLRTDYEREVSVVLKKNIDKLKKNGYSDEYIAAYASKKRSEIKKKYLIKTPDNISKSIQKRNKEKYQDVSGPNIKYLKKKKTPQEIIESATRPDGGDLKNEGIFDKPELKWRKYKDE